jgi:hypothetical protein
MALKEYHSKVFANSRDSFRSYFRKIKFEENVSEI